MNINAGKFTIAFMAGGAGAPCGLNRPSYVNYDDVKKASSLDNIALHE